MGEVGEAPLLAIFLEGCDGVRDCSLSGDAGVVLVFESWESRLGEISLLLVDREGWALFCISRNYFPGKGDIFLG